MVAVLTWDPNVFHIGACRILEVSIYILCMKYMVRSIYASPASSLGGAKPATLRLLPAGAQSRDNILIYDK